MIAAVRTSAAGVAFGTALGFSIAADVSQSIALRIGRVAKRLA